MSLNVLRSYIIVCEKYEVEPTWNGLKYFKNKWDIHFSNKDKIRTLNILGVLK